MNNRNKSVKAKEERERKMITLLYDYKRQQENVNYELKMEDEEYYPFDVTVSVSGKVDHIVEVKVRDKYSYSQIEGWGGTFLELTKLVGITTEMAKLGIEGTKILYCSFYNDQVVTYELSPNIEDYKWEVKSLQANDYSKEVKYKHVAKLDDSMIIERKNRKK